MASSLTASRWKARRPSGSLASTFSSSMIRILWSHSSSDLKKTAALAPLCWKRLMTRAWLSRMALPLHLTSTPRTRSHPARLGPYLLMVWKKDLIHFSPILATMSLLSLAMALSVSGACSPSTSIRLATTAKCATALPCTTACPSHMRRSAAKAPSKSSALRGSLGRLSSPSGSSQGRPVWSSLKISSRHPRSAMTRCSSNTCILLAAPSGVQSSSQVLRTPRMSAIACLTTSSSGEPMRRMPALRRKRSFLISKYLETTWGIHISWQSRMDEMKFVFWLKDAMRKLMATSLSIGCLYRTRSSRILIHWGTNHSLPRTNMVARPERENSSSRRGLPPKRLSERPTMSSGFHGG
mmetsp:Transcript_11813/g.30665  ORF Transcript_11813/g.30665 Transcript_11813/m.30665 type:complete len:353 (+) Transcript_11813:2403-3461(+)